MADNKQLVVLMGEGLVISLRTNELAMISMGASSPGHDRDLEHLAHAHSFYKFIGRAPHDNFMRQRVTKGPDGKSHFKMDYLEGPTERLEEGNVRVLTIEQKPTKGYQTPRFITAVYDSKNIAFLDSNGDCLYICLSHIINMGNRPYIDRFNARFSEGPDLAPPPSKILQRSDTEEFTPSKA